VVFLRHGSGDTRWEGCGHYFRRKGTSRKVATGRGGDAEDCGHRKRLPRSSFTSKAGNSRQQGVVGKIEISTSSATGSVKRGCTYDRERRQPERGTQLILTELRINLQAAALSQCLSKEGNSREIPGQHQDTIMGLLSLEARRLILPLRRRSITNLAGTPRIHSTKRRRGRSSEKRRRDVKSRGNWRG